MARGRIILVWAAVAACVVVPLVLATASPLLAWRDPIYILAGLAGVAGLAILLIQPLLVAGYLPGLGGQRGRLVHRWVGAGLVAAVVVHVAALWVTSPPDVVDVLLFRAPAPFSVWGVVAMWAIFLAGLMALLKPRVKIRVWRTAHSALVAVAVAGTALHALLIEGTMETASKLMLCAAALAATVLALRRLRVWAVWHGRGKRR